MAKKLKLIGPARAQRYFKPVRKSVSATEEQDVFNSVWLDTDDELDPWLRLILRIGPSRAERQFTAAMERITRSPPIGRPHGSGGPSGPQKAKDAELAELRREFKQRNPHASEGLCDRWCADKLGIKLKSLKRRQKRQKKIGDK